MPYSISTAPNYVKFVSPAHIKQEDNLSDSSLGITYVLLMRTLTAEARA